MRLGDIVKRLDLKIESDTENMDNEIISGYCSDLLSDVMGNVRKGSIWVTLQTHKNVLAVAALTDVAAILITGGAHPDQDMLSKAEDEGIPVLSTSISSFEIVGRLYEMGIRGMRRGD